MLYIHMLHVILTYEPKLEKRAWARNSLTRSDPTEAIFELTTKCWIRRPKLRPSALLQFANEAKINEVWCEKNQNLGQWCTFL